MGIDRHLADRSRRLARHSEEDFERDVIPRARERARRRQPTRGIRVPAAAIDVNQYAAMVSSELLSKVIDITSSQKIDAMIRFSVEMTPLARNTVVQNIDQSIEMLRAVQAHFIGSSPSPREINPTRRRVRRD